MACFGFCITESLRDTGSIGLILAWNRFDIETTHVDEHPNGTALYAIEHLIGIERRFLARSRDPISIPEEKCPVYPDGSSSGRRKLRSRDLCVDFSCAAEYNAGQLRAAVALDFYEGSSLAYSAEACGAPKVELAAPSNINLGKIEFGGRLKERPFDDELFGLSLPGMMILRSRDLWTNLMTPDQASSWF